MTVTTIATQYRVTEEQIAKAHRVVKLFPQRQIFYQVESQTTPGVEYTVQYNQAHRVLTCTCPAGNPPIIDGFPLYAPRNCWHLRAACAAASEYRAQLREEEERDMLELSLEIEAESREYSVQVDETSSSLDGVKFAPAGKNGRLVPMR